MTVVSVLKYCLDLKSPEQYLSLKFNYKDKSHGNFENRIAKLLLLLVTVVSSSLMGSG